MSRDRAQTVDVAQRCSPNVIDYALEGVRLVGDEGGVAQEGGVRISQQQTVTQLDCKRFKHKPKLRFEHKQKGGGGMSRLCAHLSPGCSSRRSPPQDGVHQRSRH